MKLCGSCHDGFHGSPASCPSCGADLRDAPERSGIELSGMRVGDRYELAELLGEGAMGWVYRGVHRGLDRSVAVKLLKTTGDAEPDQVSRFEREARAVSRLTHPHIVAVIDFGRTPGGLLYLITELVAGQTLAEITHEQGLLPVSRAVGIFHQILAAVEEAHSAHVIHRDLKPENILVTPLRSGDDFIKVLDFGIAVMPDEPTPGLTAKGGLVGTPGFMAPEAIREGRADERSDIYALGAILYELLTGRPPFVHEWPMALLAMHLTDEPTPLREAIPGAGYTAGMERVVARALAKDPAARFATVADLRADLLEALGHMGRAELHCDRCTRPLDPFTGLCVLHGPGSLPPRAATTASDATSRTLASHDAIDRDALVERLATTALLGRQTDGRRLVDFLLGDAWLLEVAGDGAGPGSLLASLALAAENVGLRVLRLRPDHRRAQRPWYPVRRLAGELLGCSPEPASPRTVTQRAESLTLGRAEIAGLSSLFGFYDPTAPEPGPARAAAIHAAMGALLGVTEGKPRGSCLLCEGLGDFDRASLGVVRALPRLLAGHEVKVAVSSDGALWPTHKARLLLRPSPLDADGVGMLLDRLGVGGDVDKRSLAGRVARLAVSSPLHAEQAVRAYAEGGDVVGPLGDLVAGRVRQLPPEAAALLQVVCGLGSEVSIDLLRNLEGQNLELLAIDLLLRRGLLAQEADRSLSPAHPSLATAVLDAMAPAERLKLHDRLASALERNAASVFLLAYHANEAKNDERALRWLEAAGDEACRWSDHETAAMVHYRRASHVARWQLLLAEDDESYLELQLKMADALRISGPGRAAAVVLKGTLGAAAKLPALAERARRSLDALERGQDSRS
jgi:hypothetical protein